MIETLATDGMVGAYNYFGAGSESGHTFREVPHKIVGTNSNSAQIRIWNGNTIVSEGGQQQQQT